jgi:membrane protein required for colicin V production
LKVVDIIILLLLALGAYGGYKKGLFVAVVTFIALIIAIVSSFRLLQTGIEFLEKELQWESVLIPYIAFVLIFFLVFFLIFLMARAIRKAMNYTLLGSIDNLAGGLLGVVEAAFAVSLLLWLSRAASITIPHEYTNDSFLLNPLTDFAPSTVQYVSYVIPFRDIFPSIQKLLQK